MGRRLGVARAAKPNLQEHPSATPASSGSDATANLAAHTFRAGLVDECQLLICPVFLGAGKSSLPRDTRADLELLDERRFSNGVVYVRYRVAS